MANGAPKPKTKAAAPAGGRIVDLDAARAARAEASGEPVTLRLAGQEFTLPVELPVDFLLYAADEKIRESIGALLGDQADAFFALRPSLADITALAQEAGRVYGVGPGEAEASPAS